MAVTGPCSRTAPPTGDPAPRSITALGQAAGACRNVMAIAAPVGARHNRIWLIQRGRGNGPLKPRQPATRESRARITVPIPTRALRGR